MVQIKPEKFNELSQEKRINYLLEILTFKKTLDRTYLINNLIIVILICSALFFLALNRLTMTTIILGISILFAILINLYYFALFEGIKSTIEKKYKGDDKDGNV